MTRTEGTARGRIKSTLAQRDVPPTVAPAAALLLDDGTSLTWPQVVLLAQKARTRKRGPSRSFSIHELQRKRACQDIDLDGELTTLERMGILRRLRPRGSLWVDLRPEIEHGAEIRFLEAQSFGVRPLPRGSH